MDTNNIIDKIFKLTEVDCKYYCNEDKRTCVCLLTYSFYYRNYDNVDPYIKLIFNEFVGYDDLTAVGKTICHSDDKFDTDYGCKIAYERAKIDIYKQACGILVDIITKINKISDVFANEYSRYDKATIFEKIRLANILDANE